MPVSEHVHVTPIRPASLAFLHDRIIQIVNERSGIKETDLTMDIMSDILDRDYLLDPLTSDISAEMIFGEIHQLIRTGRIAGIDCEIGEGGYTFLVPAGTRLRVAVPIQDLRTRH